MTKEERQQLLAEKLIEMSRYEEALRAKGLQRIAGVDEVGRGPLAGPVVAAAVVLPADFSLLGVDDSKKLSEKKREELFEQILACALDVSLGLVNNETIDEINILEATKRAMKEAIEGLREPPEHVLIDALILREVPIPQTGIVKGDSKSVSIAAASIIAKVTRDRMMRDYNEKYPGYAFDSNKGYGTAAHYAGIEAQGLCPLHRRSFLKGYAGGTTRNAESR